VSDLGMECVPLFLSQTHSQHFLYARKHESNENSSLPPDRTLFLANLPVDCTKHQLARFFKSSGPVENIVFEREHTGEDSSEGSSKEQAEFRVPPICPLSPLPPSPHHTAHTAHIIFLDSSAIPLALSTSAKRKHWPPDSDSEEPMGLRYYLAQYDALHPPLEIAKRHADTYMEHFEFVRSFTKPKSKYNKGEAIVDAEGFTLVTRGGAYGNTLGGGVAVASKKFQLDAATGKSQEPESKKKKKEKPDFYTFQIREQKRKGPNILCLPVSLVDPSLL
jgi:ribosomal RNA-processing protein 7